MIEYDSSVAHPLDGKEYMDLYLRLALSTVSEINIKDSMCSFIGVLDVTYFDERLQWKPSEQHNITTVHMDANKIWQPDILALPQADVLSGDINTKLLATIHSNGTVRSQWPVSIRIPYK
jgi:hypothetical protein